MIRDELEEDRSKWADFYDLLYKLRLLDKEGKIIVPEKDSRACRAWIESSVWRNKAKMSLSHRISKAPAT